MRQAQTEPTQTMQLAQNGVTAASAAAPSAPPAAPVAPVSSDAGDNTPDGNQAGDKLAQDAPGTKDALTAFPDARTAMSALAASAAHAAVPTPALAPPLQSAASSGPLVDARQMVALRVAHAVRDGIQTVSIDLHPAELGHVGVQLSFHDGGISVQMTLSRQDTYDSFARDRGALAQQFAQAGINLGSGGIDLRFGQPQSQPGFAGNRTPTRVPLPPQGLALGGAIQAIRSGNGLLDILA